MIKKDNLTLEETRAINKGKEFHKVFVKEFSKFSLAMLKEFDDPNVSKLGVMTTMCVIAEKMIAGIFAGLPDKDHQAEFVVYMTQEASKALLDAKKDYIKDAILNLMEKALKK